MNENKNEFINVEIDNAKFVAVYGFTSIINETNAMSEVKKEPWNKNWLCVCLPGSDLCPSCKDYKYVKEEVQNKYWYLDRKIEVL